MIHTGNTFKDRDYYFEDGNCVIGVQNYLFNLHRTILRKHSLFFRRMFLNPRNTEAQEIAGEKDDCPIICDDPVEAFRAWCWALYAGFQELEGPKRRESLNEERLGYIGWLAHKYECDTIEKWAEKTLDAELQAIIHDSKARAQLSSLSFLGGTQSFCNLPSIKTLGQLLCQSHECSWPYVRKNIELLLLGTIQGTWSILGTSESAIELRRVLDIAGEVKDEALKARAYYAFIQSVNWCLSPRERRNRTGGTAFTLKRRDRNCDSLSALTDTQKICLYRGYLSFSSLRSELRNIPEVNVLCGCLGEVEKEWKSHARRLSGDHYFDDPKSFLEEMKRLLDLDSPEKRLNRKHGGECKIDQLSRDIDKFLIDMEVNLVHFFTESGEVTC